MHRVPVWLPGEDKMTSSEQLPKLIEKLQTILANPQEDLETEFKAWLNLSEEDERANLAQAILAIANHGGGHVVLGFTRSPTGLKPIEEGPTDLNHYSPDEINNIVKRYAEPRFQCRVDFVSHPFSGDPFPIITVPGGHKVPIRAKSETSSRKHVRVNAYYIRRPGPESSEPQTGQEWDEFIRRCVVNSKDDLLSQIRHILGGFGPASIEKSTEQVDDERLQEWIESGMARFQEWAKDDLDSRTQALAATNHWISAYWIQQDLERMSPLELRRILKQIERQEPGGPYWYVPLGASEGEPWNANGIVELGQKPVQSEWNSKTFPFEFWRASPQGLMLLLQGYDEDFPSKDEEPQKCLRVENPIWDVAACCFHAARLAQALEAGSAQLSFAFSWTGLRDRRLVGVEERKHKERLCRQQTASARVRCSVEDIKANSPEIVRDLTIDLYQGFSFYEPTMKFIEKQISDMKRLTPGILEPYSR
jgi:hypothetical protein